MYDRQTESWWQQALGEAIVGELIGSGLVPVVANTFAWAAFRPDTEIWRPGIRSPVPRATLPRDPDRR